MSGQQTPAGAFYKRRRESYVNVLLEYIEEKTGSEVKQNVILEILELNTFQKRQATNAVKQAFPNSVILRKGSGKDRVTFYKNIALKSVTIPSNSEPTSTETSVFSLPQNDSPEITNLKELIQTALCELECEKKKLDEYLSTTEIQNDAVKVFLLRQNKLQERVQELQNSLTALLQKEVNRLIENQSKCETLCAHETIQLNDEITVFIKYLNRNIESKTLSGDDFSGMFSSITNDLRQNCPLLFNILDTILLQKRDQREVSERRVKRAVHSLAILLSLKSQKIPNDFKLMFTCLCISFGAGLRFISMLNHLGLTVSWEKAMKFFDSRRMKQVKDIATLTPADIPVILMIDNINIYRGKQKYLRLFKSHGPKMWNFTAQLYSFQTQRI